MDVRRGGDDYDCDRILASWRAISLKASVGGNTSKCNFLVISMVLFPLTGAVNNYESTYDLV